MEITIKFELTLGDYYRLLTVLEQRVCYLQADIRALSRNKYGFSEDKIEKLIAIDENEIKDCSALVDKLEKIYFDEYFNIRPEL